MSFRARLLNTLRAAQPVIALPGVMVVGSELPNLLEPDAAATLVVSEDVDIAVAVEAHATVKSALQHIVGLHASPDEPSVWLPDSADLIEVNFVGRDRSLSDPEDNYVLEDDELPLLVFGALTLLGEGRPARVEGIELVLPRTSGLLLEKLLTERSGEKGDRDLLVVLGLLLAATSEDLAELEQLYAGLRAELRHSVRANLAVLSLLGPRPGMPDPRPHRARIVGLLRQLERHEAAR
jgi:hypothetical protein